MSSPVHLEAGRTGSAAEASALDLAEIQRIVTDPRLTPEAQRLVMHVYLLGPGEHEIPQPDLLILLRARTDKPIRAAVVLASSCGYLQWRKGGRSHAGRYMYVRGQDDESAEAPSYPAHEGDNSAEAPNYPDNSAEAPSDSASLRRGAELSGPHAREARSVQVDREGGRDAPPVVPLTPAAEAVLAQHADLLTGCRGSIRDYLAARVPPQSQPFYVQRLATILRGIGHNWHDAEGAGIPPPERPALVAAALNELLQSGERTVRPPMTPMKWPDGDVRNLTTKLKILCSGWGTHGNGNGGKHRSQTESGRGTPTGGARADRGEFVYET